MKATVTILALVLPLSAALALDPPPGGGYPHETTALGDDALLNYIPSGIGGNTALGYQALMANTKGYLNTGVGEYALKSNTTGQANDALGSQALTLNTTGSFNVGLGGNSLLSNTTGSANTAVGEFALFISQTGNSNTAVGHQALLSNAGAKNTAVGESALFNKAEGDENIAIGYRAGLRLITGSNNIMIGNQGAQAESGVIRIGTDGLQTAAYLAGVSGTTVASGVGVVIGSNGQLGTVTSSARYKDNIQPMKDASKVILSLKPVTFRYRKDLDPTGIPQFGLVAEQVAAVDPDLVARDKMGKPYTVRYDAVNAMLLNEFLKEHQQVEEQAREIAELRAAVERLEGSRSATP